MATTLRNANADLIYHYLTEGTTIPVEVRYLGLIDSNTGVEVVAGGFTYARLTMAGKWGGPTAGDGTNTTAFTFSNLPACIIDYWALYDAASAGNEIMRGQLTSTQTVLAAGALSFAVGNAGMNVDPL